jgi:Cupin superfamily protein
MLQILSRRALAYIMASTSHLAGLNEADAEAIRAALLGSRAAFWRTTGPVADLLPWSEIDILTRSDAIPADNYYLGFRGGAVPRGAYRTEDGGLRFNVVQAFLDKGASLVIDHIERYGTALGALARDVAAWTGRQASINAYMTFGPVSVFAPHTDDHDVLALQIHGVKRWRLSGAVAEEHLLQPSCYLYVPSGLAHEAVPVEWPSVHLSIGLTSRR